MIKCILLRTFFQYQQQYNRRQIPNERHINDDGNNVSTQLYFPSMGNHSMLRLSAKVIRTVLCARYLEMAIHSVEIAASGVSEWILAASVTSTEART